MATISRSVHGVGRHRVVFPKSRLTNRSSDHIRLYSRIITMCYVKQNELENRAAIPDPACGSLSRGT